MAKAFTCDICGQFFNADPNNGAHTTLADNIPQHAPIDICNDCTAPVVQFINQMMKDKQAPMEEPEPQAEPEE